MLCSNPYSQGQTQSLHTEGPQESFAEPNRKSKFLKDQHFGFLYKEGGDSIQPEKQRSEISVVSLYHFPNLTVGSLSEGCAPFASAFPKYPSLCLPTSGTHQHKLPS